VCDALALPGQKMSAQTLNLQKRAATPLNLQKEAAVEIGAPFGAVDDQLPRRRRKAAVDRRTVSGAIDDQLPRRRRKAAVEIGAPFLRCRRSARDEEGKLPLRIAARLKSSGLEARFEGFRGVERDLKDFRGVFLISDVETQTPDCVHTMTLVDDAHRRPFLLLGPFSAALMPTNPGFVFCLLPPCWSSFLSPKIRLSEPFEAWTIVWMSEIRRFLGLRECSPLLFSIVLF
jgi:hypothetical protein